MFENSVVCAITKTHEKNQDEIIIKLKSDLQNERDKKEDLKVYRLDVLVNRYNWYTGKRVHL
jgi:hypothetical protein